MKPFYVVLLIFLLSCGGNTKPVSPAHNSLIAPPDISPGQVELIFNSLQSFPENTQASIVLIKDHTTSYYGVERQGDSLVTINNKQSVFEIGSISKVFTSVLLAHYVMNDEVDLDDQVSKYLDISFNNNNSPTFQQLSNHTSGLPRMPSNFLLGSLFNRDNPYKNYDVEKLEEYLEEDLELENEPGVVSAYSNLGVGLLGHSLSNVSGKEYQTMLDEIIFAPYQMSSSTTIRSDIAESLVPGLDAEGDRTSNWDLNALVAAGGILSTGEDMSRFAKAQFDTTNAEMNLARQVTFSVSPTMDMGLGWHILYTQSGDTWYWHNGGTGGYRSSMAVDTQRNNAVILLTNISAFHKDEGKVDDLCFDLMRSLEDKDTSTRK